MSFAFILFIEKIATDHTHSHDDHGHSMIKASILKRQHDNVNADSHLLEDDHNHEEDDDDFEENIIREGLSTKK